MRAHYFGIGPFLLLTTSVALAAGMRLAEGEFAGTVLRGTRPEVDQAISKLKHRGVTRDQIAPVARMLSEGPLRGRQNAAYVFTVIPDPAFTRELERSLSDADEVVRSFGATALGKIHERGSAPALMKVLGDPSPVVRREAVKALGAIGDKAATRKVTALLEDQSTEVRVAVILALGALGDKASEKVLLPLLKDASETTRLAATRSLCALGNAEGRKLVEGMLAAKDAATRRDGIRLLEGQKAPWVREALLTVTRDKELDVAIAGAKALALSGDGRGVEWLVYSVSRVDLEASIKIETILEDLQLTPADRKTILGKKPSPGLVLPAVEAEKAPAAP